MGWRGEGLQAGLCHPQLGPCPPQAWCVSLADGHGASALSIFALEVRRWLREVLRLEEGAPCFPQVPPPGLCQPLPPPSLSHPAPSFCISVRSETEGK